MKLGHDTIIRCKRDKTSRFPLAQLVYPPHCEATVYISTCVDNIICLAPDTFPWRAKKAHESRPLIQNASQLEKCFAFFFCSYTLNYAYILKFSIELSITYFHIFRRKTLLIILKFNCIYLSFYFNSTFLTRVLNERNY